MFPEGSWSKLVDLFEPLRIPRIRRIYLYGFPERGKMQLYLNKKWRYRERTKKMRRNTKTSIRDYTGTL